MNRGINRGEQPQPNSFNEFASRFLAFAMTRLGMFNINYSDAKQLAKEKYPRGTSVWMNSHKKNYGTSSGQIINPVEGHPDHNKTIYLFVEHIRYSDDPDDPHHRQDHLGGMWDIEQVLPMTPEEIQKYPL